MCIYFFKRSFWFIYIFLLYTRTLFLKIKYVYLEIIFFIYTTLYNIFSLLFFLINLICESIFNIILLNKKLILIKKFSEYNRVNILSYKIKYLIYTNLSIFWILFLIIINIIFINTYNSHYIYTHIKKKKKNLIEFFYKRTKKVWNVELVLNVQETHVYTSH